jgi:rhodanese-related sulfurtransferase
MAANVMLNKMTGKVDTITAKELKESLSSNQANIVDVREEVEFFISAIPGAVNIPMVELAKRQEEIDKSKETIILVCKVGIRAFLSYLQLKQLGFENIKILEGGMNAYPYEVE